GEPSVLFLTVPLAEHSIEGTGPARRAARLRATISAGVPLRGSEAPFLARFQKSQMPPPRSTSNATAAPSFRGMPIPFQYHIAGAFADRLVVDVRCQRSDAVLGRWPDRPMARRRVFVRHILGRSLERLWHSSSILIWGELFRGQGRGSSPEYR